MQGWTHSLLGSSERLDWLIEQRMLMTDTIVQFGIGWDRDKRLYTIPVRDVSGVLVNIRLYDPNPKDLRRKIWGYTGHNETRLFPVSSLDHNELLWLEGEWDTLLAIQLGYNAITRTGAATSWQNQWNPLFKGKRVSICQDRDTDGVKGARKVQYSISSIAADVRQLVLPYDVAPKAGKDFTDFIREHGEKEFAELFNKTWEQQEESLLPVSEEPITVIDSFDARRVGEQATLLVTIKGKKEPGYTLPQRVHLFCDQLAGDKCTACTLNGAAGDDEFDIDPSDPMVLELVDSSHQQVTATIARAYGIPGGKCNRLHVEATGHQAVEILFARPSIDHAQGWDVNRTGSNYTNIRITSVGRHNTMPNTTVRAKGALYPSPRSQSNEWLAHEVDQQATSVDHFEITDDTVKLMKRFQPKKGQRPLSKLAEIERELARHVTKIYGRPEMHALIDLTFHSVLSWHFGGELEHRGWLECLVLGDTRTGKSAVASKLVRHFGVGEVVGGESASVAGLLGGLQSFGQGKEWTVTWGVMPQNNRRLVVIDEASGLSKDEIAKLSDARSSGVVNIRKIQSDVAEAMTRLLWLSNPRDAKMADFTYGIQAIFELIGKNEDIARFDLVMCVSVADVPAEKMNRPDEPGELLYTSEACNTLVRWVWTRGPDKVIWAPGAEDAIYKAALEMGKRYVEEPPLVQPANVRMKIGRLAIALAARLFSTDKTYENVLVKPEHVIDAVAFMDKIYGMKAMGYSERSKEIIGDRELAKKNYGDVKIYLHSKPGLAKFLKVTGSFRRQDIEEVLNIDRASANGVVNKLLNSRMVRKAGADIKVEPTLHELLRTFRG